MKVSTGAVLVAAAAAALGGVDGAVTKRTYSNTLSDGSLGFCAGVITKDYWVEDDSKTQEDLEVEVVQAFAQGTALSTVISVLPATCTAQIKEALCLEFFPPAVLMDPFFLNTCGELCGSDGKCPDDPAKDCAPRPGLQIGRSATAWTDATCSNEGFSFIDGDCFVILPKFACKETCSSLYEVNNGVNALGLGVTKCPLISGQFVDLLNGIASQTEDDDLRSTLNEVTADKASSTPVTAGLITIINGNLNCAKTKTVEGLELNVYPTNTQDELFNLVDVNIDFIKEARGSNDCAPEGSSQFLSCTVVGEFTGCASPEKSDFNVATVQPSFAISPSDVDQNVCANHLSSRLNQDNNLNLLLSSLESAFQDPAQAGTCLQADVFNRLYFVPPALGTASLPPILDNSEVEIAAFDGREEFDGECPNDSRGNRGARFGNLEGSSPLCTSARGVKGFNARDCLLIKTQDANLAFPRFSDELCRAAFLEVVCARAQMKLESKFLCLNEDGCEAKFSDGIQQDRVGFSFALPRFPSKKICQKFADECSDFIAGNPQLEALATCDIQVGPLLQGECAENGLGKVTGCQSPFASLPQYPETTQTFLQFEDFPAALAQIFQFSDQSVFQSSVVEPTLSASLHQDDLSVEDLKELQENFCDCPEPLVAPDNVNAETIPNTCCAIPCQGTMITIEQYGTFGSLGFFISSFGVIMAFFMVATWSFFESKQKQYIPFWFMVTSLLTSVGLWLIPVSTGGDLLAEFCVDNSTPKSFEDEFSLCVLQGIIVLTSSTWEVSWWLVQAIDLFRKVVLGTKNTDGSKRNYHLFAWSTGIIVLIIVLATGRLGFKNPNPFCSFSPDIPILEEILFYYAYIGLAFLSGLIMMLSVLAVIARHSSNVAKGGSTAGARFRARYRLYRTPILFVTLFVFVWMIIFLFRIIVSTQESLFRDQASAWVQCLLGNSLGGVANPATDPGDLSAIAAFVEPDQVGCGITQPGGVPFLAVLLLMIVVYGQSIFVWMIFAAKWENWDLWMVYLGCSEPRPKTLGDGNDFSKGTYEFTADDNTISPRGAGMFPNGAGEISVSQPRQVRLDNHGGPSTPFANSFSQGSNFNRSPPQTSSYVSDYSNSGRNKRPPPAPRSPYFNPADNI
eukprot:CAMPEP_0184541588 /NCGR_PEP_ID=MMETSP0199_2-20130426/1472_1 /TAXON_ID=1112570 /ORGANISM="Thraustochytrium sp., Strain LLF1b" /LENGTH=1134 /DNA_ID=CAMNT_0026935323 /DNA_START=297 /DNA_END=3701 /DNA_ORIENTATION=+